MPYVQRTRRRDLDRNHDALVRTLERELNAGLSQKAMAADDAPTIVEEQMRNSDRLQVYVIWNGWEGVRENHRSTAILDAYENAKGKDYAARIVIALGVTTEEAKTLGLEV